MADISASALITRGSDGRYTVERGQQVTVVTAAALPTGYPRFYLQWRPLGNPSPTSHVQLIPPLGMTYTFTPTADAAGPTLITYDLTAARPRPLQRPGQKPEFGDVVATTVFQVAAPTLRYDTLGTTGAVTAAGSYAFLEDPDDTSTAVTTYEGFRDGSTTALLVHKADAYGASQAALYDAVTPGDLFEWRQAADCFVRYQVTGVICPKGRPLPGPLCRDARRERGARLPLLARAGPAGGVDVQLRLHGGWPSPTATARSTRTPTAGRPCGSAARRYLGRERWGWLPPGGVLTGRASTSARRAGSAVARQWSGTARRARTTIRAAL